MEHKTLKKKEESEKTGEKTGKSNKWSQSLTLQLKEYLNDNFDFRYNNLTGATEYREKSGKNCFRPIDERRNEWNDCGCPPGRNTLLERGCAYHDSFK